MDNPAEFYRSLHGAFLEIGTRRQANHEERWLRQVPPQAIVNTAKTGFSLFCATSSGGYWKGIPILVCPEPVDRFKKQLKYSTDGLIVAELTPVLSALPCKLKDKLPSSISNNPLRPIWLNALDAPELVLVIDSPRLAERDSTVQSARAVASFRSPTAHLRRGLN